MNEAIATPVERFGAAAVDGFRKLGYWRDDSLAEWLDHWAERLPAQRAVSDGVTELTWAELRLQAYGLARWLRAHGVEPGDRVAAQLPNWAEFIVTYLAVARLGAILVPIMPVYRSNEVGHILRSSGARVVVTTGEFRKFGYADMFRELRDDGERGGSLRHLVLARTDDVREGETSFAAAVASGRAGETADGKDLGPYPPADAGHAIIYTSGTESTAKGGYHTWNTLSFCARGMGRDVFRMTEADVMYMPSPVTHSTGLVLGLATPLMAGAAMHLQDVWEPHEGLRRIEAYRCSITASATPFVTMALAAGKESQRDLSSLRIWLCAGAPIPSTLAEQFASVFTHGKLLPLYGSTEVLAATCCRLEDTLERVASSDGRVAYAGVKIKLMGADGQEVAPGEPGEICYWGPGAILGYWRDPERTAATVDREGWHHSGDLARMDADGYMRVTGRLKDIIIRGGQNLSAREIEEHLMSHPQVLEASAVACPDERLGEKVCAFVVQDPKAGGAPLTLAQLTTYLRDERRIATQKIPELLFVVDALPMTATGKVQKYVLRERAREHLANGST